MNNVLVPLISLCLIISSIGCTPKTPAASNANVTAIAPGNVTTPAAAEPSPAQPVPSRPNIPEGTPIITMDIRTLLGGTFEKLDIYSNGEVIDVKDTNLRRPPPDGPTRVWRTGQIQAEELNGLIRLFQSSEFASLNQSYTFPGKPTEPLEGPPLNGRAFGDAGYGFTLNSTELEKRVVTFGYLAPGDMPYPLGELYTKLRAVVDEKTSEVYREHIKYD